MTTSGAEAVTGGFMAQFRAGADSTAPDAMGKDTFLQLLVAQLRYQDPMNPTDSAQFLAQSARFTALEKMEDVADQTARALAAQMAFGASSMVGQTVSYATAQGESVTGNVDAVRFTADGPMLDVDGTDVALTSLRSVSDPSTDPPA